MWIFFKTGHLVFLFLLLALNLHAAEIDNCQRPLLVASVPSQIRQLSAAPLAARQMSPSGINGYHLMTKLFGEHKNLYDIIDALPAMNALGINTLWLSPPNPQTIEYYEGLQEENVHGYWVANHGAIDPNIGGEEAFTLLVNRARAMGIEICVDAVLNHFGYGSEFQLGTRNISINDPKFFRIGGDDAAPFVVPREAKIYELLNEETDPRQLRLLQEELTTFPLFKLPSFRHDNVEIQDYLINSYKKFIDRGITTFRIDAVKHIKQSFFHRFLNEMNAYAEKKGIKLTFISELLLDKSPALAVFAGDAIAAVRDNSRVFFLDFPLAREFRKLQDQNYKFPWLMGFVRYRMAAGQPLKHYIPMIEDHDFGFPVRDKYISLLTHVLSEFFSFNSAILHHGGEEAGVLQFGREPIKAIRANGDLALLKNKLVIALAPYRTSSASNQFVAHTEGDNVLVVERSFDNSRSIFVVANKSYENFETFIRQDAPVRVVAAVGEASVVRVDKGLKVRASSRSLLVFELIK